MTSVTAVDRPAARIRLRVDAPDGSPASAARVEVRVDDRAVAASVRPPTHAIGYELRRPFGEEAHAVVPGTAHLELPAGTVGVRVERGPEYVPAEATVTVAAGDDVELRLRPEPWIDMAALGWWSADLHGHRAPDDLPLLMAADGLDVATCISDHNGRPQHGGPPAGEWWRPLDGGGWCSLQDVEVERLEAGTGAFIGHTAPLAGHVTPAPIGDWEPTEFDLARAVRRAGGHVQAEKPFWRMTPALVVLGLADSIGVVCNHVGPTWSYPGIGWLGATEPDDGLPDGDALVAWLLRLYDDHLDAGFVLPAVGGSASGWMPAPLGFARTYVRGDGLAHPESFRRALADGRTVATNGPMLWLDADGAGPGEVAVPADRRVLPVRVHARASHALEHVELVRDGEVVAESHADPNGVVDPLEVELDPGLGAWLSARAYGRDRGTVRFAVTSPVRLPGDGASVRRADALRALDQRLASTIAYLQRVGAPARLLRGYDQAHVRVRALLATGARRATSVSSGTRRGATSALRGASSTPRGPSSTPRRASSGPRQEG